MFDLLRLQRDPVSVDPHVFADFLGIPITNTLITGLLVTLLIAIFGFWGRYWFALIPGKVQNAFELLYEEMLTLIQQITAERSLAVEVFPLIAALFIYIGLSNLITLLPGLGSITLAGESLLRTPTSDINLPLALATATVLLMNARAIISFGFFGYAGRFFKFKELLTGLRSGLKEGFIAFVEFFVGLLNILFEFSKAVSLSFRLFGSMFASELLAILVLGAVAYALPAVWMSMNLLFAVVQALVFGALVAAYYTLAVQPEGDATEPTDGFKEA